MSAHAPAFVVAASEALGLSPELLRLAKRDDALDAASLRVLLSRLPADERRDGGARALLLAVLASAVRSGLWSSRRAEQLVLHAGAARVGPSASALLALVAAQRTTESAGVPMGVPTGVPVVGVLAAQRMLAQQSRIQHKLRRLRQLERARAALLKGIAEDPFVQGLRCRRPEAALALGLPPSEAADFPEGAELEEQFFR